MARRSVLVDFVHNLSDDNIISFLQDYGVLPRQKPCSSCQGGLCRVQKYAQATDKHVYRCVNCRQRRSLRDGTVFQNSKLSFSTLMILVYGFITEVGVTTISGLAGCSEATAIRWYAVMRRVCAARVAQEFRVVGGPGHIVEIDETCMCKRKFAVGRIVNSRWVWGAYCPSLKVATCAEIFSKTQAELVPLVLSQVAAGSVIHSDMLASYNELRNHFQFNRVNHSVHFVDPRTGATTNRAESFWSRLKRHLKRVNGSQGEKAMDHAQEAVYRQNYQLFSHTPWEVKLRTFLDHLLESVEPLEVVEEEEDTSKLTKFSAVVSTTTMLRRALFGHNQALLVDGTHQTNTAGYKVISVGTEDRWRRFHLIALAVTTEESSSELLSVFETLQHQIESVRQPEDPAWNPKFIMADGSAPITSAAARAFPEAVRLNCYYHVKANFRDRHSHLLSESAEYTELLRDLSRFPQSRWSAEREGDDKITS